MSGFNVRVKLNPSAKVIARLRMDKDGKATEYLRNTVERLSRPFVPGGAGGMLAKLVEYPNKHSIKYTALYAHYQYMGKLYLTKSGSSWARKGEKKFETSQKLKYHVAGTGAKWNRLMMQRRKNDVVKEVENFIKRGG